MHDVCSRVSCYLSFMILEFSVWSQILTTPTPSFTHYHSGLHTALTSNGCVYQHAALRLQ